MLKNKPIVITLICMLTCYVTFAQKDKNQNLKNNLILSGKLEGLKNEKIYLTTNDLDEKKLDSTFAKNGRFYFKENIKEPMLYFLRIANTNTQLGLFLESGKITISGHKDSLSKAIVKGSRSNDELKEWYSEWTKKIQMPAGTIYRRLDSVTQRGKVKTSAEEQKIFDEGMKLLSDQTDVMVTAFIKKYSQSSVAPFIIYDRYIGFPNPEMAKKSFALLGANARNSLYGKKITDYQRIAAKTGIGATPDFSLADTSGKIFKLSDLRGKYVLVDFWASWCAPCRKENPNVVKAYNKFHDKGLDIVGVSLDTKKDAWIKAINHDGLTWDHVSDLKGWDGSIVKEFGINVVPTNFLLDKDGKVIAKNLREEVLQKKLEELLK